VGINLKMNCNDKPNIKTKDDIVRIGKTLVGKKIGEIIKDEFEEKIKNKGHIGQIIEECVFGQKPHNDSLPDFPEAGVELKVSPVKKLKNGIYSAKERIVLNLINYKNENTQSFEDSSFWKKNKNLYVLFYEYMKDLPKTEYKIYQQLMLELSIEDRIQIEHDWQTIANKIKTGNAHTLSEGDTLYLGACTKGLDRDSKSTQKNGLIAKNRAYSYKTTFVNHLLRKLSKHEYSFSKGTKMSIEQLVHEKIRPYIGKSKLELLKTFSLISKAKNINEYLISGMLGYPGKKVSQSIEFKKANIKFKTIVLTNSNKLKESMSLDSFKFKDLVNQKWEDSDLYEFFLQTKFAFCVFKGNKENPIFKGIGFWNMPEDVLENDVKPVWEKTFEVIKNGSVYKDSSSNKSNFPKISENGVCHVRPKARNSRDISELPFADKKTGKKYYTKQCFWLNSKFVLKILFNGSLFQGTE
jgi:DNA mismatch repair protein MutH